MARVYSFDGSEGVGKTSIIAEVSRKLEEKGYRVLVISAFGTAVGQEVRKLIGTGGFKNEFQTAICKLAGIVDTWSTIRADKSENTIYLMDRGLLTFGVYDALYLANPIAMDLIEDNLQAFFKYNFIPDIAFTVLSDVEIVGKRLETRETFDFMDKQYKAICEFYQSTLNPDHPAVTGVFNRLAKNHFFITNNQDLDTAVNTVMGYIGV